MISVSCRRRGPPLPARQTALRCTSARFSLLCFVALAAGGVRAQRTTIHTRALQTVGAGDAVDAGPLSVSEPLTLTVRLRPTAAQSSALDHLLAAQTDSTSASYHQWLTPEQFAAEFGASDEQLAMVKSYFEANGMTVSSVSAGRTRLTVRGNAGQAQLAFETSLHRVRVNAADYFANATDPSLPAEVASVIAGISGLDDLPQQASARIAIGAAAPNAVPRTSLAPSSTAGVEGADSLVAVADAIDANTTAVLSLASSACGSEIADADVEAYRALFRQASAQGITVLAAGSCQGAAAADFPGSLAEVTALAISPRDVASATPGIDARPSWQAAPGLPADGLRHEPDVTTSSAAAFAQTIATLNAETGNRVGNVGATLYALAKIPGLFTQPDATREGAGNWEPASGLGVVDLKMLLKVYPRGLSSTVTYLQSTSYAINYGDSFTLKAQVVPSVYGTTNPTGTVTFTSSTQGTLGSTTIDNGGNASLTPRRSAGRRVQCDGGLLGRRELWRVREHKQGYDHGEPGECEPCGDDLARDQHPLWRQRDGHGNGHASRGQRLPERSRIGADQQRAGELGDTEPEPGQQQRYGQHCGDGSASGEVQRAGDLPGDE